MVSENFKPLESQPNEEATDTLILSTVKLAVRGAMGAPLLLLVGPLVALLRLWIPLKLTIELIRDLLGGILGVFLGIYRLVSRTSMSILTDSWFWIFVSIFACMASLDGCVLNFETPCRRGYWYHYDTSGQFTVYKSAFLTWLLYLGRWTSIGDVRRTIEAAQQENKEYEIRYNQQYRKGLK